MHFITHYWQKLTRGYCYCEIYNLDITIAKFIIPRLECFSELPKVRANLVLSADIRRILWSLTDIAENDLSASEKDNYKRCQEGLDLLGKHFLKLWD